MKSRKSFLKKALSYILIAAMCVPDVAPMAAYAADYAANKPRYVSFELPDPLRLEDLGLSDEAGEGNSDSNHTADDGGNAQGGGIPEETAAPEETVPEATTPETAVPETTVSETTASETTASETTGAASESGSKEESTTPAEPETSESESSVSSEFEKESLAELPKETKEAELREPDFFYTDVPEEPEGILVDVSEQGSTYLVEENVNTDEDGEPVNSYITVIGKNYNYYKDNKGQIRSYDNTLVPVESEEKFLTTASPSNAGRARTAFTGTSYENAEGSARVQIPEHMGSGKGYMISDGEHTLELVPTAGDFSHSMAADNAIRYSSVFENVDFQYTVIGDTVKEDIILLEKQDRHSFSYKLKSDGLNFKRYGNAVIAYEESDQNPVFRITAPVLIDSANQTSIEIKVKYDNSSHTVTFDADQAWLNDPDRIYPVRIDPGAELVGYDAFSINMVAKGDTEKMAGTGRVDEKVRRRYFGDDGHTMVGYSRDYGHCRAMISIDTAWESLINHSATHVDGKPVKNVQFSVGVLTYDTPQRTPFMLRVLKKPWDPSSVTFENAEAAMGSSGATGTEAYSSGSGQRLEFDITEAYYGWLEGKDRFGLLMEVEAENEFDPADLQSVFWAETLYNRSGMKNGPRLEVAWEGSIKDLSQLTMADFSLDIGPGVAESQAGGRTTRGILAHGASQVESTIDYTVYRKSDDDAVAGGIVTAHGAVDCPDYQKVDPDCLPFDRQDSNWQSEPVLYGEELELNTIYYVWAQGTGYKAEESPRGEPGEADDSEDGSGESAEEELSEPKQSDPFLLYEVQATDLISRIARHYGVTIKQLKEDNQFLDQLTVAGDILFIKNPATSMPYTKPLNPDKLEEMLLKLLMEGKDPRCAYDMEPVNMSNGSFYMSQTDAHLTDLGGSFPIERSYNSLTPYFRSEFGMGWNSLAGEKIMVLQDGTIIYIRKDGKGLTFEKSGNKTYRGPGGYGYELKAVNYLEIMTEQGETSEEEREEKEAVSGGNDEKQTGRVASPSTAGKMVTFSSGKLFVDADAGKDLEPETQDDEAVQTEAMQTEAVQQEDTAGTAASEEDGEIEKVPSSAGWELTSTDGVIKQFNSSGLLVTEKDRKGYTTYYVYDLDNLLKRIVTPGGKEYAITQTEEEGLITQIVLPDGGILSYEYSNEDDLIKATNPAGGVRRYEYDPEHHMTAWYDENGTRVVSNTYDDEGRVISQTDASGYTGSFQYSDGLTVLKDNNGNETRYYQDSQYRNIRIEHADGTSAFTVYNDQNQVEARTNEVGTTTAYTYDDRGNVLTEQRADGTYAEFTYNDLNLPVTAIDYEGNVTSFTYDEAGNLLSSTDGAGNTITCSYDSLHRLVSMTDARGSVYTYEYDGAVVTSYTDPEGNQGTFTYDAMNRVLTSTSSTGETTTHVYNANGWETETTFPGQGTTLYEFSPAGEVLSITDGMGVKTTFTYDAMHNILSGKDALGSTLTYTYDGNYNKVTETDAKGNTTAYHYDARNNISMVRDALGNSSVYTRDGLGNVTSLTDRRGGVQEYWYHKVLGLPTMSRDALGHETYYQYDGNGNVTKISYPDGSSVSHTYDGAGRLVRTTSQNGLITDLTYDGNGNIIKLTDDEIRSYTFEYDKSNRLIHTTDPLGGLTEYEYDAAGNQTGITDGAQHSTRYSYDAAGRLTEMKNALDGITSRSYNLNGSLLSSRDENGGLNEYHYDVLGQLLAAVNPAGGITAMEYDSLGNVIKTTDALKGEAALEYDALSRTTRVTDAMGHVYIYEYDAEGSLIRETKPDGDIVEMTYDAAGQLITAADEAGVVTVYIYDSMGRVVKADDTAGNHMTCQYDAAGNLVKQTDTIGRTAVYGYDKFNRLISVKEADGAVTSYGYDVLDRLTSVTQADGTVTAYEYDRAGNLIKTTEPGEAVYTYAYDAINRVTSKADPVGAATTFQYDAKGNLLVSSDGNGVTNSYVYDVLDRLTALTDGNGGVTSYGYDELSRLLSVTTPEGSRNEYRYDADNNLIKSKDSNGLITEYRYDVMGNLMETISPKGAKTAYTYDKHDELTGIIDPSGNITGYTVDLNRQVTKMTQKNGGAYKYTYDKAHRLASVSSPLGYIQNFVYDDGDNIIEESDSLGRTSTFTYDIMHRMTAAVNPSGGVETYEYDIRGNRTGITNANNHKTTYVYDLLDRLNESIDPEGKATKAVYDLAGNITSVTMPGDRTTNYYYDRNYNLTSYSDPMGYVYQNSYDKDNRQTTGTDPLKQVQTVSYDAGSRITSLTDKMGLTQHFTYDVHGNVLASKATDGLITKYQYDILDELTMVTDPMGYQTLYNYDVMGNVTSVTNAKKNVTKYTYDVENNLTSIISPMGRKERFSYDQAGRLKSRYTANGDAIRYDYDRLNGLADKNYYDSKGNEKDHEVRMGYDSMGQRISMEDITGGSVYTYDSLGRLKTAVNGSGKTVEYEYDSADNLAVILYPDGKEVQYTYDKNDNITAIKDRDGRTTASTYDALNRMTTITRPNGISTAYVYNAGNQVQKLENTCSCGFQISSYEYTYNNAGLISSETARENLYTTTGDDYGHQGGSTDKCKHQDRNYWQNQNPVWETTKSVFKYDNNGQLTEVKEVKSPYESCTYTYQYDEAGNRIKAKKVPLYGFPEIGTYVYNQDNQMTTAWIYKDTVETEYTYKYDANGNMLAGYVGNCAKTTMQYDTENRLKAVYDPFKLLYAAAYDGDGNRAFQLNYDENAVCGYGKNMDGKTFVPEHSRNEDGSLTAEGELFSYVNSRTGRSYDLIEYVNDTNREYTEALMEYSINGGSRTAYSYGNQRLSLNKIWKPNDIQTMDVECYYGYDGRGSVTNLTDCMGMSLNVYQYDPYGQMTLGSPLQKNLYGYNGESYNPNTGLEYLRARYYNAGKGRFVQEDTYLGDIADPLTLNRYGYVKNSPLNYVDPSGNELVFNYLTGEYEDRHYEDLPNEREIELMGDFWEDWVSLYSGELEQSQKTELLHMMKEATHRGNKNLCEVALEVTGDTFSFIASLLLGAIDIDDSYNRNDIYSIFRPYKVNETAYYIGQGIRNVAGILAGLVVLAVGEHTAIAGAGATIMSGGVGALSGSIAITAGGVAISVAGCTIVAVASEEAQISFAKAMNSSQRYFDEKKAEGDSESAKKPTSQGQMQNQVKKGQAPKGVNRVDPADSNIPSSKPHIHFGENEAALNSDGTWHDAGKPHPTINNKVEKWILDNGWKLPTD